VRCRSDQIPAGQDGIGPVPGRTGINRALIRNGLVVPGQRKRLRAEYRRCERNGPGRWSRGRWMWSATSTWPMGLS
jgi:hypothetical protein